MISNTLIRKIFLRIFGAIQKLIQIVPQYIFLRSENKKKSRFEIRLRNVKPCLVDATTTTGFDRHYVFHTAWAARILARLRPAIHTDISSSLFFIGTVSAFINIKFLDYRPANLKLSGVDEEAVDILNLPFESSSIESLSCMHVVEHIGLGRYGDPIDYDGDIKAIAELKRVIAVGGSLLFVVPLASKPYIAFNAHRVYGHKQVLAMFENFTLIDFSLIPENPRDGGLVDWPTDELVSHQKYACGCYHFQKIN